MIKTMSLAWKGSMALLILAVAAIAWANTAEVEHVLSKDERRAMVLLNKAVRHIEQQGVDAVTDFNANPNFIDKELYVYALRVDGRFLASGGSSTVLAGDTVLDTVDVFGKPFFREMIQTAVEAGKGVIEYHWTNPTDSRGEAKRTFFIREGDIIVAVGYYPSRSTDYEARHFLDEAVKAMVNNEPEAIEQFNQSQGPFVKDDLYVFVLDMQQGQFIAHGATPSLVGQSHVDVLSPDGKPVITEMLDQARKNGKGELVYQWQNPTTGKVETKHTYYRVLDNKLVGVGFYNKGNE
ncbi:cache domain-containing protein [Photobacterium ganghwense]|nr:cache domain-containing protein [Photobacterium ganghwense]